MTIYQPIILDTFTTDESTHPVCQLLSNVVKRKVTACWLEPIYLYAIV